MKILTDPPKEGNFVAVWEYSGCLWSGSFQIFGDDIYIYEKLDEDGEILDDWVLLDKSQHPAFEYNPLGGVTSKHYLVKE